MLSQRASDTIASMHKGFRARTRIVQSPANRWVKALRAAVLRPPGLRPAKSSLGEDENLIALEGFHLLEESYRSGLVPLAIFLREGEEDAAFQTLSGTLTDSLRASEVDEGVATLVDGPEWLLLPPALFASVTATEASQGIMALVRAPEAAVSLLLGSAHPLVLVLAGLQDPGNVGAILRSAEAFCATGAILLSGTATPWNPKCLRASAGSALRLPMLAIPSAEEASALLREHDVRSYAAVVSAGHPAGEVALGRPTALWIGNEGSGLTPEQIAACDGSITLPMPGEVESLNAAIAASLLLYEASRQRHAGCR